MRDQLLASVWNALGGDPDDLRRIVLTGPEHALRSRFPVTDAAVAATGAALLACTADAAPDVELDSRHAATTVRSERLLRIDDGSPGDPFDPLSAFHRTADGWLRLHANYPWHRAAARHVLDLPADAGPDEIRERIAARTGEELEAALHGAGGVAAAVRDERTWRAHPAGAAAGTSPLVERRDLGTAAPRPSRRARVLDLTRVIAGPVATRTLAAHGADVLRLDPPDRPEIPLQAWDMLPGKRSALLDLARSGDRLTELLAGADVVVTGYRPGALDRFGLAPEALAERFPGLVVVTLSAWGHRGPWAHRRGFDSLVQAACGIGETERADPDPDTPPGALPAQLLDHATGHLAAAGAALALASQRRDGGTPHVRLSLAATAAWLQSLPRTGEPGPVADPGPAAFTERVEAPDGVLTLVSPPGRVGGRDLRWPAPPPSYGTADASWPDTGGPA
ncbi:MAG: CoA transferase [Pseudonocardia sediminis]